MEESKVTLIHIGIVLPYLHFASGSGTESIVVTPIEGPEAFDREVLVLELLNGDRTFFVQLVQVVGILA